ncbi:MAG: site-specific integrase [Kiritimatiellia bacterium]
MGLEIRKGRNGQIINHWYGRYTDHTGKRRCVSLSEPMPSTGIPDSLKETGSSTFEASRARAEMELDTFKNEAAQHGRADHLTEKLIESKTGRKVEYVKLSELPDRWRKINRNRKPTKEWMSNCNIIFKRFADSVPCEFLHEVTPEQAARHIETLKKRVTLKTANGELQLLKAAFRRFLPPGAVNPFKDLTGGSDPDTVHRRPFTALELHSLFEAARADVFIYPLIVCAACSGLRRGDVCRLKWDSVNLREGILSIKKTSKTGAAVEIPIFKPLREVFEVALTEQEEGQELVFPDAAKMLRQNPDGLTWRFKKIAAGVVCPESGDNDPESLQVVNLADILPEVSEAVAGKLDGKRRDRTLDTLQRYAQGQSVRTIEKKTGRVRSQVSGDLHLAEEISGFRFMPLPLGGESSKALISRATRGTNKGRARRSSTVDWHSFRTTWVTLALAAGVPMEICRRVTGHKTVETVLTHYFRPDREHMKSVLGEKLPDVLTGNGKIEEPQPDISELATQLARLSDAQKMELQTLLMPKTITE